MTEPQKNKGKVVVFSPWYPPHIGGLESHAHEFNLELVQRSWKVLVLTPHSQAGGQESEMIGEHLTIIRFPVFELIAEYPLPALWHPRWWKAWQTARHWNPHLVISRTRFFSTTILAWWYHTRTAIPWLHIEHGADYVHLGRSWANKAAYYYDRFISRFLLKRAQALVANSKASARFITLISDRTDITIIYRGVPHKEIADVLPHSSPSSTKTTIIYSGRLIAGKGIPLLLHALATLRHKPIQCLIIGSGPQHKELVALTKTLGLTPIVTFLSHLPWRDTIAHLKSADIFVNPSYSEGLPTGVIEAALCKAAIIATNVGGTPEIIQHRLGGLLIPANSVEALQEALAQLIDDPSLRHRLTENAYQTVSQTFTWPISMTLYENIFNMLRKV